MKTHSLRLARLLILSTLLIATRNTFALGADHPNDQPIIGLTHWPAGLEKLVNVTNRVHGFFVNQEDTFFYSGDTAALSAFLADYAKLDGVVAKRLIQHEGVGEAKSPWAKEGRPCDWKLYVCPKSWHNLAELSKGGTNSVEVLQIAAKEAGYIVEVHVWIGGRLALDQVEIPKTVEVTKPR
jgi:hypothetical protein